jgi:hypothetical protein
MMNIRFHLNPFEEAMLVEVQKSNKRYRDIEFLLLGLIRDEYAKTQKAKSTGHSREREKK